MRGYAAALSLTHKAQETQIETKFFNFAPNTFHHAVIVAAMFIIKIANSKYSLAIDQAEARKAISSCHTLIKKMSLEDNDLRGRTAKLLHQLWNYDRREPSKLKSAPAMETTTRPTGNLLRDAIWLWRQRFGAYGDVASLRSSSLRVNDVVQSAEDDVQAVDGPESELIEALRSSSRAALTPDDHDTWYWEDPVESLMSFDLLSEKL